VKRRDLLKAALAVPVVTRTADAVASADAPRDKASATVAQSAAPSRTPDADFIVVGSGAGGGTVAARLVEEGYSVLVLEAGGLAAGADYDVPAFHGRATESEAMRWDFFVHHYMDAAREQRDPKYVAAERGVWYPRAATLGGCTAHNAMIFIYPSNADWDQLADLTGDPSWRADRMRTYFERLEDCRHRGRERALGHVGINPSRHGYSGWLSVEKAAPAEAIRDGKMRKAFATSVRNALKETGLPGFGRLESLGDPNDWRVVNENRFGACYTPMTTRNHQRVGSRERLLAVRDQHPERLRIELDALATRVLFDDQQRAIGVEYLKGERLYAAHARPSGAPGEPRQVFARREVILAGGAFNTPQLLMLSGIGPEATLRRHGIPVVVSHEQVGRNLQDRYEVPVVNRLREPWDMLVGATYTTADRQYREWASARRGAYTSNGALLSVIARSSAAQPSPDLYCYALLGQFKGYAPGYSRDLPPNYLTWVVLKGHTNNTAGDVTLASADPRMRPEINFRYFEDGSDAAGEDLEAVVSGVRLARRMARGLSGPLGLVEELPGPGCETDEQVRDYVRTHAWGHHASCTCAIGPRERGGVLDSNFAVHGTRGLRVVDASVFPRVPGLFIASAVYMIGEKAADVIARDARRAG
jgi:choline dehydrogenase